MELDGKIAIVTGPAKGMGEAITLALAGCGTTTGERATSGAGVGAAVGAGAAAVTGGSVTQGAVIGGGVGAATGAATDEDDINLD